MNGTLLSGLQPDRYRGHTPNLKEVLENVISKRKRKLEETRKREKTKQLNVVEKEEEKQEENKVN